MTRSRHRSHQVGCEANLKQMAQALQLYADANGDALPGPVSLVPQVVYSANSRQELAWFTAEHLGCGKPSTNEQVLMELLCPASPYRGEDPMLLGSARSYVLNENINKQRGSRIAPFGSIAEAASKSLKLSQVSTFSPPFCTVAMRDADKANVDPTLPSWRDLPYRPVHGKTRTELFFDWHVEVKSW